MNHGADDLLEVTVPGAPDTALIPFTKAIVPTVDLAAGGLLLIRLKGCYERAQQIAWA